jgi:hypothetical protein
MEAIVEKLDPDTGRMYFLDPSTGKTGWTRAELLAVAPPAPSSGGAVVEELLDDATGRTYFRNTATGKTSWTREECIAPAPAPPPKPKVKLNFVITAEGGAAGAGAGPAAAATPIVKEGDVVEITKPGKQKGNHGRVLDPDWKGLVKVEMTSGADAGQTKSFDTNEVKAGPNTSARPGGNERHRLLMVSPACISPRAAIP